MIEIRLGKEIVEAATNGPDVPELFYHLHPLDYLVGAYERSGEAWMGSVLRVDLGGSFFILGGELSQTRMRCTRDLGVLIEVDFPDSTLLSSLRFDKIRLIEWMAGGGSVESSVPLDAAPKLARKRMKNPLIFA